MFSPGPFRDVTVGRGTIDVAIGLTASRPGTCGIYGLRTTYLDGSREGHVGTGPNVLLCVGAHREPSCGENVSQHFDESLPGS